MLPEQHSKLFFLPFVVILGSRKSRISLGSVSGLCWIMFLLLRDMIARLDTSAFVLPLSSFLNFLEIRCTPSWDMLSFLLTVVYYKQPVRKTHNCFCFFVFFYQFLYLNLWKMLTITQVDRNKWHFHTNKVIPKLAKDTV